MRLGDLAPEEGRNGPRRAEEWTPAAPAPESAKDRALRILHEQLGPRLANPRMSEPELMALVNAELNTIVAQLPVPLTSHERQQLLGEIIDDAIRLGPLEELLNDETIAEIMINSRDKVWIERRGRLELSQVKFETDEALMKIIERIVTRVGRRIDESSPFVDARLPDGSRVNAIIPPLALNGPSMTIRKFPSNPLTMDDLISKGTLTPGLADFLAGCVKGKLNILISGGTGSGKALDVETLIPTPSGFVRMGDLKAGDQVFDESGKACHVTGVYDQPDGRECFEVVFSDGTTMVADADHNWLTETRQARRAVSRQKHSKAARTPVLHGDTMDRFRAVCAELPSEVSLPMFAAAHAWEQRDAVLCAEARHLTRVGTLVKGYRNNIKVALYRTTDLSAAIEARYSVDRRDQRHRSANAEVVTTSQIRDSLRTSTGHANHSVAVLSAAVDYPRRDLPLDPYLLGIWLGDGATAMARITTPDPEIVEAFRADGWTVRQIAGSSIDYGVSGGFQTALRAIGVLGNKHIPDQFLYASEAQRRALLAGLMDSDGTVDKDGRTVSFSNCNHTLATQFRTLVASLGYQVRIGSRPAKLNGVVKGTAYNVVFTAPDDVFRLTRKADVHRQTRGPANERQRRRYIVDVRPVPSRPVRCITVDSASHLFLAGDQYIPTHNTTLLNILSGYIPAGERVVSIEDAAELQLKQPNLVRLESRPANVEGKGAVAIRELVSNALRMRPDRIVVGECRSGEALDMLQAMNTGHDGSLTTLHANSPRDALSRLETLVLMAGTDLPSRAIREQISSAIHLLVQISRMSDGTRRIVSISEVVGMEGEVITAQELFKFRHEGMDERGGIRGGVVPCGIRPRFAERLGDLGVLFPRDMFQV